MSGDELVDVLEPVEQCCNRIAAIFERQKIENPIQVFAAAHSLEERSEIGP